VQTFVLAAQTNGYFVLNDIFRYLAEEPEEDEELQQDPVAPMADVQESAPTSAAPEAETEGTPSEEDLTKVDQKLEDVVDEEPTREASPPPAAVNGTPNLEDAEVIEAEEAPAAAVTATEEASSKEPDAPTVEEEAEPEKPKDPAPTPMPAATKTAPVATPVAPSKPSAPRTWASLAASAHRVAMPAIPASSVPQPPSQPKAAAPAQNQPLSVPTQTSTPAREPSPANSQGDASGWQTAGPKKEPARVQNQTSADAEQKRAYIKNVYSQVEEGSLRSVLSKFGDIEYLDISRPKVSIHTHLQPATPANSSYRTALSLTSRRPPGIKTPSATIPTRSTGLKSRLRSDAHAPNSLSIPVVELLVAAGALAASLAVDSNNAVAAVLWVVVAVVLLRKLEQLTETLVLLFALRATLTSVI
jgi:hypothetical protein